MNKSILFISRHAPYGSSLARDALDALLASAAYDQQLSLLFMDDGVLQLLSGQHSEAIQQKNFANVLPVLELYEIDKMYVHQESLLQRGIESRDLMNLSFTLLTSEKISELMSAHQQILSF